MLPTFEDWLLLCTLNFMAWWVRQHPVNGGHMEFYGGHMEFYGKLVWVCLVTSVLSDTFQPYGL